MLSIKLILLFSLSFFFAQPLIALATTAPLYYQCLRSYGHFSLTEPFAKNLQAVLASLAINTSQTGFAAATVGRGNSTAYGVALCRGNISPGSCKACVATAIRSFRHGCDKKKEAYMWYTDCQLHYANYDFLGTSDNSFRIYKENQTIVTNSTAEFIQDVVGLLNLVSAKVYMSPTLYATAEADITVGMDNMTIYSMAQCTRDLGVVGCKSCLGDLTNDIHFCCDGRGSVKILKASCYFRYELYPFY